MKQKKKTPNSKYWKYICHPLSFSTRKNLFTDFFYDQFVVFRPYFFVLGSLFFLFFYCCCFSLNFIPHGQVFVECIQLLFDSQKIRPLLKNLRSLLIHLYKMETFTVINMTWLIRNISKLTILWTYKLRFDTKYWHRMKVWGEGVFLLLSKSHVRSVK